METSKNNKASLSVGGFYGARNKRKWQGIERSLDNAVKRHKEDKIPTAFKSRILGPSTKWETFYRQQDAFSYARSTAKDLHVFAFESETFVGDSGQRMYLVASYPVFWHYYSQLQEDKRHHYLEEKIYDSVESIYDTEFYIYFKRYWKRFLDDCFVPWTKSREELIHFHDILNNLHKDIKFTLQSDTVEQSFLDVMVRNKRGNIETDIYYKETDSKQYLLFSSCHPRHTKTNIPYNLARRLRTIISEEQVLETRMNELKTFLVQQKYPENIIDMGIDRAMNLDRTVLRQVAQKTEEPVITYVSTHNPRNAEIFNTIKYNFPILQEDPKMKSILSKFTIIKSKRQPNNLKRILTKAKFSHASEHEVKRCQRPNCGLCTHLLEGTAFDFNCGRKFYVHETMTCEVKNVIYVMKCRGCGEEYIGETGNYLRKRVTVHNQQIRDPSTRMLHVSEHITA